MCGIFGWVLPRAHASDRALLVRLTERLAHRGPDGSGFWLDTTADGNFQLALGHRRLSIIDIGGGAQPMWSADGRFGLIFNGEIYNYIELRDELRARGHVFATQSDSEVLIEAWRAWGDGALARLRGMFAFALWDATSQELVLARDAFGKKPLFFAEHQGGFLFGSEIAPLLGFPGLSRAIEPEALGQYLLNRYVPGPLTFFRAIKKLQPGCAARWRAGRFTTQRYCVPPLATTQPDVGRFEDAVEAFCDVFQESVRIRMRSDAPYGAFLSGGLDSSAVVSAMARESTSPVKTFSVGFREDEWSELGYAQTIADRFGTEHRELVVEPDSFLAHWPLAVERRGAPVSESSDIPILMLSKMASESVKMVLTGEGSDELLGGYPKHRAEQWVALYQRLMPRVLHTALIDRVAMRLPYGMRRLRILANVLGERDGTRRARLWFGGIAAAERAELLGEALSLVPPDPLPFSLASGSALRRTLFFDQTSWLPDNLLERGDRMMMAGGIEGRMPFMDVELAKLAARLPDRFLTGRRGGKRVLRAALAADLPADIVSRKKIGFRVPFHAWFRGRLRAPLCDMLVSEHSQVAKLCNPGALRQFLNEHLDGRRNNERILWTLANLELFLRRYRPELGALAEGAAKALTAA